MARRLAPRLLAVCGLVVVAAVRPVDAHAQGGAFTPAERAVLARGGLVVRPEEQRAGQLRLIGGVSWQVVEAPPAAVWRATFDTAKYSKLLPQVARAETVEIVGDRRVVWISHEHALATVRYYLDLQVFPEQRAVQFRLDPTRPHGIREAWGFFNIRPYGQGRSVLSWGVMVDVGTGIVAGFLRPKVHEWLLRVPQQMKRFIEGEGRARYGLPTR